MDAWIDDLQVEIILPKGRRTVKFQPGLPADWNVTGNAAPAKLIP